VGAGCAAAEPSLALLLASMYGTVHTSRGPLEKPHAIARADAAATLPDIIADHTLAENPSSRHVRRFDEVLHIQRRSTDE
jgi:hypothetical protein